LGWYKYFDPIILSHEERILKPDKRIYEILLERIGLKPFQCVYVDDQLKALQPAIDMGFKTILFRDMSQMESELKSFGIKGF
jgi:HAD superfamily hydrolase (TIGR01509 family)